MVSYASTLTAEDTQDVLSDLTVVKYRWTVEKVSDSKRRLGLYVTLLTTLTFVVLLSTLVLHH